MRLLITAFSAAVSVRRLRRGPCCADLCTLLSLLVGLYVPTSGQVVVQGRDLRDLSRHALRRHVVLVSQDPGLVASTIRENIGFGFPAVTDVDIEEAASCAEAAEFIQSLPGGYTFELGVGGSGLSAGQKQRIALARALVRRPAVLILDEATSNLDPETERRVLTQLRLTSAVRTTILATHRMGTAALANRILVLEHGRLVDSVTPALLAQREEYFSRMMSVQATQLGDFGFERSRLLTP